MPTNIPNTTLIDKQDHLVLWSLEHYNECFLAILNNETDKPYVERCIAAIIRRRADVEPAWLEGWAIDDQTTLRRWAARQTTPIRMAGYTLGPGLQGYDAWIAAITQWDEARYATPPSDAERESWHRNDASVDLVAATPPPIVEPTIDFDNVTAEPINGPNSPLIPNSRQNADPPPAATPTILIPAKAAKRKGRKAALDAQFRFGG